MSDDTLKERFEKASRGREVKIMEKQNTPLATDYSVCFKPEENCYHVEFTSQGYFEGAYCFLEQWIRTHAEQIDGVYKEPPPDHLDIRGHGLYGLLVMFFDQFMVDFQTAIDRQINVLNAERPEPEIGVGSIKMRTKALQGIRKHFVPFETEVHSGVLSPQTIRLLKNMGLPITEDSDHEKDPS